MVLQIAPHVDAANLVLGRTGWKVLDLQVTVDARGTIKRERATALDLYVAADRGAAQTRLPPVWVMFPVTPPATKAHVWPAETVRLPTKVPL